MSWGIAAAITLILAVAGAVAAFATASLAVDWLRIPGREGEIGYFAVLMGIFGIIAGVAIGLIAPRHVGGPSLGGFAMGLGVSAASLSALIGGAGLWAWLQSDPWPQFAGKFLALEVELRSTSGFDLDLAQSRWSDWLTAQAGVANGYKSSPDRMALRFRLAFAPED